MPRAPTGPVIALLLTQLSFASLAIAGKIALAEVPPLLLAGIRLFFASLFLAGIALVTRRETPTRGDLGKLLGLAMLGIICNQILFLEGLSRTTAINATILVATIPVFTTLIAILIGQERLGRARLVGILVAFAGVLVLLETESFSFTNDTAVGNLLVILNSLSYSLYLVFSRPLLHKYRSTTVVAWIFLYGAVFVTPLAALYAPRQDFGAMSEYAWLALAWIILVPSVLAYSLNNYALKRVRSSTVATYVFLQPVFGVALALLILQNESLSIRAVLGGALVLAGLVAVTRSEHVEPLIAIPESGEAMSRQPIEESNGGTQSQPQEDHRRRDGQEAP